MPGVLKGLTVLDLTQGIAGPLTGMLLADQGARVIKIEPPGGDPSRSLSGSRVWNRGKQSIVLDLKSDERQTFVDLVRRADVLIESFSPGTTERLGVDYETLRHLNARLVFCSITGYGDVRRHANRPAVDALVAARVGLQWEKRGWPGGSIERVNGVEPFMADLEIEPENMEGPPRQGPLFSAVPWPSMSAFYLASIGISAALHAREVTGRGQRVRTSLLQGALVNGAFTWQRAQHPQRPGYRMWVTDPRAPHGFFKTADSRWIHHWTPQPGFVLTVSTGDHLEVHSDTRASRTDGTRIGMDPEELVVLREYAKPMAEAFARFTTKEWEEVAAQAGLSVQPVRSPEEALQDPSFLADGCVVEVDDPEVGRIRHVGMTYHLHGAPGGISGPSPLVGQHTNQILAEMASGIGEIGQPGDLDLFAKPVTGLPRGPLDGIVVLDIGLAVAGPFGTQMLADLGADVIKINRSSDRSWTDTYMGMCCNRGKRSIVIDLKSAAGMTVLKRLVERADVVHTNMRWDSVEALGIDYEALRAVNPKLIYCHTRGFENGDRMLLLGHDQSGSALAGVAWEEGGLYDDGKPIWPNISLGDTGNGMLSATAVIQALYHRDRTGEGQFVDTSIVYVHLLNASAAWVGADGAQAPARPHLDAMQLGLDALYRLYETADGWLCLAAVTDRHWQNLCGALARPDLADDPRFTSTSTRSENSHLLGELLGPIFAQSSAEDWFAVLDRYGVPAEISSATFGQGMFDDPELIEKGLIVAHQHPLVGKLEMFGRTIDFSETPGTIERGPIVAGQHTQEILAEYGYDPTTIEGLIAQGAVAAAVDLAVWID
jgi:crotonobetainyl-CoA:carnitine CoA-transferase CaiB-like acyl-CoA transferase